MAQNDKFYSQNDDVTIGGDVGGTIGSDDSSNYGMDDDREWGNDESNITGSDDDTGGMGSGSDIVDDDSDTDDSELDI
jgi:hypothetical protein